MNKAWHENNPLPKSATLEQRITWHLVHAKSCACRSIPEKLKAEIRKRKIKV